MYTASLLFVSVAPGVLFLVLIMRMDRREPEPLSLVLKVIAFGAVSAIPAGLLEMALDLVPQFRATDAAGVVASSFIQVAPVEELCKLAVVLLLVWRNPNFNEENDGIVYMGASAIGFAVLENVIYVLSNGMGVGLLRAFTSIPLHVFTAVAMGFFLGKARFAATTTRRGLMAVLGFLIAWFLHGLYDSFALSAGAGWLLILPIVAGVSALGIVFLKRGQKLSAERWATEAAPAEAAAHHTGDHRWIRVVSRVLLIACGAFWAFLLLGTFTSKAAGQAGYALLGGLMMSFLPLSLGIILAVVYRRNHMFRISTGSTGSASGNPNTRE
jgi:protease PrsW